MTQAVIPPPGTPIADRHGRVSHAWYRFFQTHLARSGGSSGGDPTDEVISASQLLDISVRGDADQETRAIVAGGGDYEEPGEAFNILGLTGGDYEEPGEAFNILGLTGGEYEDVVPSGVIVIWYGDIADIPDGWVLCDGTNGTPDLQDKFIVGAGSTYSPGDVGGSATVDLQHTHGPGTYATDTDATTNSASLSVQSGSGAVVADDPHNHSHEHSVTSGLSDASLSTTEENRPPYHSLAFIMKV